MEPAPLLPPLPPTLSSFPVDQPKPRAKVIETLLKYVHTDSALCRYEPGPIADRQAQVRGEVKGGGVREAHSDTALCSCEQAAAGEGLG